MTLETLEEAIAIREKIKTLEKELNIIEKPFDSLNAKIYYGGEEWPCCKLSQSTLRTVLDIVLNDKTEELKDLKKQLAAL